MFVLDIIWGLKNCSSMAVWMERMYVKETGVGLVRRDNNGPQLGHTLHGNP